MVIANVATIGLEHLIIALLATVGLKHFNFAEVAMIGVQLSTIGLLVTVGLWHVAMVVVMDRWRGWGLWSPVVQVVFQKLGSMKLGRIKLPVSK